MRMYEIGLGTETLVGRTVLSASINDSNDVVVLETAAGKLYLSWTGDCCAHCFLANVSGADALIGGEILEVETADWIREPKTGYEVYENMGTKIKTTKGYVTLESRLEHNGYYDGRIQVHNEGPLGHYGQLLKSAELVNMRTLTDF